MSKLSITYTTTFKNVVDPTQIIENVVVYVNEDVIYAFSANQGIGYIQAQIDFISGQTVFHENECWKIIQGNLSEYICDYTGISVYLDQVIGQYPVYLGEDYAPSLLLNPITQLPYCDCDSDLKHARFKLCCPNLSPNSTEFWYVNIPTSFLDNYQPGTVFPIRYPFNLSNPDVFVIEEALMTLDLFVQDYNPDYPQFFGGLGGGSGQHLYLNTQRQDLFYHQSFMIVSLMGMIQSVNTYTFHPFTYINGQQISVNFCQDTVDVGQYQVIKNCCTEEIFILDVTNATDEYYGNLPAPGKTGILNIIGDDLTPILGQTTSTIGSIYDPDCGLLLTGPCYENISLQWYDGNPPVIDVGENTNNRLIFSPDYEYDSVMNVTGLWKTL